MKKPLFLFLERIGLHNRNIFSHFREKRILFEDGTPPLGDPGSGGGAGATPPDPEGGTTPPPGEKTPPSKPGNSAEARIQQLSAEKKEALEKLAALETEKADLARKEKERQGEFQALYEEEKKGKEKLQKQLEDQKALIDSQSSSIEGLVEKQMENIPEAKRGLVKCLLDGKTTDQKLTLIPDLIKEFSGSTGGFGSGMPGGAGKPPPGDVNLSQKLSRHKELTQKAQTAKLSPQESLELMRVSKDIKEARRADGGSTVGEKIQYDPNTGKPIFQ